MNDSNKYIEIGSEFSNFSASEGLGLCVIDDFKDCVYTFSGRTAIETVINNLPKMKKAMLPSYCCDSMIDPFRKANIRVCFYDVNYYKGLKIDLVIPEDVDILLWCNYFGYKCNMPDISSFINRGGIIIEDITHSLFSFDRYHDNSHYLVASLRKWGPLFCGGYCSSKKKKLNYKPNQYPSDIFLQNKKTAMLLKEQYIKDHDINRKERYLTLFQNSNKWLNENYSNLIIDDESKKFLFSERLESIRNIRRTNAKCLYSGLKENEDIEMLFELEKMDCPIFVPILVKDGKRDLYRKKLIENGIYCPIHWPHPNEQCKSNLYSLELSLICDQRYTKSDMKRIISIMNDLNK